MGIATRGATEAEGVILKALRKKEYAPPDLIEYLRSDFTEEIAKEAIWRLLDKGTIEFSYDQNLRILGPGAAQVRKPR